jgi:RNA polymerase-interacting CarD/CdnL/TRCF family regulator
LHVTSVVIPEVGETVVFGAEGFARVEATANRDLLGEQVVFLDLFVLDSNMRVSVPHERALGRGLRSVASPGEIEGMLRDLAERETTSIAWNRDGRLVKDRWAEGDLAACGDVLGSLVDVQATKRLNDAQRTLFDKARRSFVREAAVSLGVDEPEAERLLDEAIGNRAPAEPIVD